MAQAKRNITPEDKARADRLKQLYELKKKDLQLSQRKLADDMGITQGAISQFFSGSVPLSTDSILTFSKLLGEDPRKIAPDLDKKLNTAATRAKSPVMATLSGKQPSKYLVTCPVAKGSEYTMLVEADVTYEPHVEAGQYIAIDPTMLIKRGSNVLFKLRNRSRFEIAKVTRKTNDVITLDNNDVETQKLSYIMGIRAIV